MPSEAHEAARRTRHLTERIAELELELAKVIERVARLECEMLTERLQALELGVERLVEDSRNAE